MITETRLHDVFTGKNPIDIGVELHDDGSDDGLVVRLGIDYRIVVENVGGRLTCHIWATAESVGNDPTHSIEIT